MPAKGFNKKQDEFAGNMRARTNELIRILEEAREPAENIRMRSPELAPVADALEAFIGEAQSKARRNYWRSVKEASQYLFQ